MACTRPESYATSFWKGLVGIVGFSRDWAAQFRRKPIQDVQAAQTRLASQGHPPEPDILRPRNKPMPIVLTYPAMPTAIPLPTLAACIEFA